MGELMKIHAYTRVLQKVLSLGSINLGATFYQTFLLQTFKVFPLY